MSIKYVLRNWLYKYGLINSCPKCGNKDLKQSWFYSDKYCKKCGWNFKLPDCYGY